MNRFSSVLICTLGLLLAASAATAQTPTPAQGGQTVVPITLPPVTVTAQKEPADVQRLPVSVTVVPIDWLQLGSSVSDAGL